MKIKVIGAGGIGVALLDPLCRYLNYKGNQSVLTVIDGDTYEDKNAERQEFDRIGNKAEVTGDRLQRKYPNVLFKFRDEYVSPASAEYLISEGDIVLLCVDNHPTRKVVSDYCSELDDIVLISGGNDFTDGNVQVFVRRNGQNLTQPVASDLHPEIMNPQGKGPYELGCDEQVESAPQLIFTNLFIAAMMSNAFYAYTQGALTYDEVYADIVKNACRPVSYPKASSQKAV